tara:strand:- start:473 stop:1522 length:1050 start_codon:yes stop_codon:yes gene_type:complete
MNQIWQRQKNLLFIFILGQIIATLYLFKIRGFDLSPIVAWDSTQYLNAAVRFPDLLPIERLYSGMIIYLKVASSIGPVKWIAVIGNSLAVIISSECLWQITNKYASKNCAWIAVFILLLNPLTAQWTRWVMTESLYFSAVIIWMWLFIYQTSFLLIIFSTALSTLRPNAIILIFSALIGSPLLKKQIKLKTILKIIILSVTIFIILIALVFYRIEGESNLLLKAFSNGVVIWNMPETYIEITNTPIYYINLFFRRIFWEIIQIRPWYSFRNNFFISVFMIFFYLFSMRGAWIMRKSKLFIAITLITIPSLIIIGFTWSIYEGRFGWWFLVSWIPLVAIGTQNKKLISKS